MHMFKTTGVALALLAMGAYADMWAKFCDDTACAVNCGEDVDVENAGCLSEVGRNSIYFHAYEESSGEGFALNWFADSECLSLNQCAAGFVPADDIQGPSCVNLMGNPDAASFEFTPGC